MDDDTETTPPRAAEWGLAALLLGAVVLVLFPIMTVVLLATLIGAWEINAVEWRHVEFGVYGGFAVIGGLLAMGLFALYCGVRGLALASRHHQTRGLPLAGTLAGAVAAVAGVVLLVIGIFVYEDTRRLKREHSRFRPAPEFQVRKLRELVDQNPSVKPDWDRAMEDGVLTAAEADQILARLGMAVRVAK